MKKAELMIKQNKRSKSKHKRKQRYPDLPSVLKQKDSSLLMPQEHFDNSSDKR